MHAIIFRFAPWFLLFFVLFQIDIYHNFEDVVPLIIELINEVVQKQLCYLGEVSKCTTFLIYGERKRWGGETFNSKRIWVYDMILYIYVGKFSSMCLIVIHCRYNHVLSIVRQTPGSCMNCACQLSRCIPSTILVGLRFLVYWNNDNAKIISNEQVY